MLLEFISKDKDPKIVNYSKLIFPALCIYSRLEELIFTDIKIDGLKTHTHKNYGEINMSPLFTSKRVSLLS